MSTDIAAVSLSDYTLPLRRRLSIGDHELRERAGVVLTLTDSDGTRGHGDIAPLPGIHGETFAEARAAADALSRGLPGTDSADSSALDKMTGTPGLMPSVRFGLESAWLNLRAAQRGTDLAHQLSPAPAAEVPVNALLDGDLAAARGALDAGELRGYAAVKVKVGRRPPDEERLLLSLLLTELPEGVLLRLDANRAMQLGDACALVDGIDVDRIEYFEEPLRDPAELRTLHRRAGVRIALDESLDIPLAEGEEDWRHGPGITTWVLKPSRHGALLESMKIGARAVERGIGCVVSSCFESGLGLWTLTHLAASMVEQRAAGLATDRWLAADVIAPRFSSAGGTLRLSDAVMAPADANGLQR